MIKAFYTGHMKEKDDLMRSASGGFATAVSRAFIRSGGVVFGVSYTKDFHGAEYRCAMTEEELEAFRGSKYFMPETGTAFSDAARLLESGTPVLFIGLGCVCAELKEHLSGIDIRSLYIMELCCMAAPESEAFEAYAKELEAKHSAKITSLNMRDKKNGWLPPHTIHITFDDGSEEFESFSESDFGKAFYKEVRPECSMCRYKGYGHPGDLCIGDHWGMREGMADFEPNGISAAAVLTEKGRALMDMLPADFHICEADFKYYARTNRHFLHPVVSRH